MISIDDLIDTNYERIYGRVCNSREEARRWSLNRTVQIHTVGIHRLVRCINGENADATFLDGADEVVKTILLVDDDADLVELLTAKLEGEGYRVVSAKDGREAALWIKDTAPDLVITDFMMPETTGIELVREMRTLPHTSVTPVIMISGTREDQALVDALGKIEVAKFLNKPAAWSEVRDAVRVCLGQTNTS